MGGNIVYSRTLPRPSGIVDGSTVSVTGPSASVPSYEWLGGLNGVIQSGTPGAVFSRTNWIPLSGYGTQPNWYYSTARSLSRSQSLLASNQTPTVGGGIKTYSYDNGASGASEEYFSCNYYLDTGVASQMQWKIRRFMPTEDTTDGTVPSWYTARWVSGPGSFVNRWATGSSSSDSIGTEYPINAWFRFESWTVVSSPVGTANGSIRVKCTNLSTGATVFDFTESSIITRGSGDPVYRYTVMQNYLGNETPTNTPLSVNMEDVYISTVSSGSGAFVRAELCNNSVYSSATVTRVCQVSSIVGTTWNVVLNGPYSAFGQTTLSGLYLALFPSSGSPTMVVVP